MSDVKPGILGERRYPERKLIGEHLRGTHTQGAPPDVSMTIDHDCVLVVARSEKDAKALETWFNERALIEDEVRSV